MSKSSRAWTRDQLIATRNGVNLARRNLSWLRTRANQEDANLMAYFVAIDDLLEIIAEMVVNLADYVGVGAWVASEPDLLEESGGLADESPTVG